MTKNSASDGWCTPYLFHIKDEGKIRIDWEHKEMGCIAPGDIGKYDTVPKLKEALEEVRG